MNVIHGLYRYTRLKMNNALIRILFRNKQPKKKLLKQCKFLSTKGVHS